MLKLQLLYRTYLSFAFVTAVNARFAVVVSVVVAVADAIAVVAVVVVVAAIVDAVPLQYCSLFCS